MLLIMGALGGVIVLLSISAAQSADVVDGSPATPLPPPEASTALYGLADALGDDPNDVITVDAQGTHRLTHLRGALRLVAEVRVDNVMRLTVDGPDLPTNAVVGAWDDAAEARQVLGDNDFDRVVHVRGNRGDLLARLPSADRRLVRAAVGCQLGFEHGRWHGNVSGERVVPSVDHLASVLLDAAEALRLDGSVGGALLSRLKADEPLAHRRLCLATLVGGRYPQRDAAIAFGLGSGDPEMILAASAHAGAEALPALRGLILGDHGHALTARALELIGRRARRATLAPLIDACLRQGLSQPAGAEGLLEMALERAVTIKHCPLTTLDGLLEHPSADVRARLPGALAWGGADAEPWLLRLVDDRVESIALAAARVAGDVGGLSMVGGLLARAKGLRRRAVRQAIDQSIARIQARSGTAGAVGGLTVLAPDAQAGGLSAPAIAGGALSCADDA